MTIQLVSQCLFSMWHVVSWITTWPLACIVIFLSYTVKNRHQTLCIFLLLLRCNFEWGLTTHTRSYCPINRTSHFSKKEKLEKEISTFLTSLGTRAPIPGRYKIASRFWGGFVQGPLWAYYVNMATRVNMLAWNSCPGMEFISLWVCYIGMHLVSALVSTMVVMTLAG